MLEFKGPLAEALAAAVDTEFYEYVYGKLAPGTTAAVHYANVGWREGRDPNPWFCTRDYLERHPDVGARGIVPLFHFLESGKPAEPSQPCEHALPYYERPPGLHPKPAPEHADSLSLAEQYRVVSDSFDAEYYLRENPQLAVANVNPVWHFVLQGWYEGRDPARWFSVRAYCEEYPDVAQSGVNPFYHFLTKGRAEGREAKVNVAAFDANYYVKSNPDLARSGVDPLSHFVARGWREGRAPNAAARADFLSDRASAARRLTGGRPEAEYVLRELTAMHRVTVVLIAGGATAVSASCLGAVVANTSFPADLVLAGNASDLAALEAVHPYDRVPGIRAIPFEAERGPVESVNRIVRESFADVVILSGDAIVGPRWLENLVFAAYQRPSIGTVTTLLVAGDDTSELAAARRDSAARLVMHAAGGLLVQVPSANASAIFVKRAALEIVGDFDERRPEISVADFCFRATQSGFENVLDSATATFRTEQSGFASDVPQNLSEFEPYARRFAAGPHRATLERRIATLPIAAALNGKLRVRPRVLHVVHEWSRGGTMEFCLDLARALGEAFEAYVLASTGDRLMLYAIAGDDLEFIEAVDLPDRTMLAELRNSGYRAAIVDLLARYRFELLHVHHLMQHSLDIFDVAKALGVPTIVTCHDYYLACPSYLLLDDDLTFCGGVCTAGPGTCSHGLSWLAEGPPLKHRWVHVWRDRVGRALAGVDTITTPSHDIAVRLAGILPEFAQLPNTTIEHGLDLPRAHAARPPEPGGMVRILFAGYLGAHKGLNVIAALREADVEHRLEFHFMGSAAEGLGNYGIDHGEYERSEFTKRASEIGPAFAGIFSIWAESFCYVLSEAWAAGIPAIGTALGAVGERIAREGAGWTFDLRDTGELYRGILALADDPERYRRGMLAAQTTHIRSIAEMGEDYKDVYRTTLRRRSVFAAL